MYKVAITGTGVFTPKEVITNDELVTAFNAYADKFNFENNDLIARGAVAAKEHSSSDFIFAASGITQRHVMNKSGILDSGTMHPSFRKRSDDEPGIMAEIALDACTKALKQSGKSASDIDCIIVAASNFERPYPAIAVEVQDLLGTSGFGFDMNVACSSATFGIQAATDMIKAGSIRAALVVNPEICSGHLEWRDRDCHFIFGDVCTATLLERTDNAKGQYFEILSTKCATQFSNNIRNNNGFLRRSLPAGLTDQRDMQFMQEGRKVFKQVVPMVSKHILDHLSAEGRDASELKRMWLHQANKAMNDFIGRKVLGRTPEPHEQPNILQDYANTSSAGSIISFALHSDNLNNDDLGLICSFGAGYSVGSVLLKRVA
ncbi:MAG: beta-ketoacyl-ACP synthase III [Rhodobacterales bacterium]